MKKIILSLIAAGLAGALVSAHAQPFPPGDGGPGGGPGGGPEQGGPPDMGGNPPDAGATNGSSSNGDAKQSTVILPSQKTSAPTDEIQSQFVPPDQAGTNAVVNLNDLTLHFNNAPLDMVLNYLSDAAGFVIVQDTRVTGTVTVNGKHLTRDEAVNLLNSVLNRNGYAAIRDGRMLTIVDKNDAKTREIPVKSGNIPGDIPKNAEMVTYIIPIRFVEARQLVSDLSSFVSPQATVVANEAGNSIVVTDTQANIHHLAEIIKAVDDSAEAETEVRVFRLEHANPNDVATELTSVFPSSTSGNSSQSPIRFGGGPGGFPGGGPGGFFRQMMANANSSSSSSDRIKKATQVNAVADARTSSVIVTAPKDLMSEIASMMKELDVTSARDQDVYVFQMKNGDSQAAALVLQNMFQSTSSRSTTSGSTTTSALSQRQQNNASSTGTSSSSGTTGLGTQSSGRTGGGF
jgi:type II secretory pathway component GspD/PulD (secretin)